MDNSTSSRSQRLDQLAVGLSGLCLAHCLLLPVLLAGVPLFGSLGADHFHAQMLIVVLPVSIVALGLGHRRHRSLAVVAWGAAGMLLLLVGGTVVHSRFGLAADRAFAVAGALTLAIVHFLNARLARQCRS